MKIEISKNKWVYNYCEPYIIAEIGANHNGDMDLAKKITKTAKTTAALYAMQLNELGNY